MLIYNIPIFLSVVMFIFLSSSSKIYSPDFITESEKSLSYLNHDKNNFEKKQTYKNPIIFSDYSDPDVIRQGEDFFMISSSFNCSPGIPILHSKDLVNWKIINYAFKKLPDESFNDPKHGKGCFAPSLRYHDGYFWIFFGDPDNGLYLTKTKNIFGGWEPLILVKKAVGLIDPCPLWDDDGNLYLIHAWAKSRAGFNSILTLNKMSSDGLKVIDEGVNIFDGHEKHPTIEGPKFYKHNGYYYIFAPAGGVSKGWQTVLRSKNIYGPYEDKIVLHQGNTEINGPHQGGWINTPSAEDWFIHFQDCGAYGRIVHLQPMKWVDDWPVIGLDINGDGIGEPVIEYGYPDVKKIFHDIKIQTSDNFKSGLGLQWQWQANYKENWFTFLKDKGIKLNSIPKSKEIQNLWEVPNLLLQKFPYQRFYAMTKMEFNPKNEGEVSGLLIMGLDYSYIALTKLNNSIKIRNVLCKDADKASPEVIIEESDIKTNSIFLKVDVDKGAVCSFSYSDNGKKFKSIGKEFKARKGIWIGAKVGVFSLAPFEKKDNGFSLFEWFKIEKQ